MYAEPTTEGRLHSAYPPLETGEIHVGKLVCFKDCNRMSETEIIRPMSAACRILVVAACASLFACVDPSDQRPGLWLSGEVAAPVSDWSFANEHSEIYVEVTTPYGMRHSVTVICASLDGALYMGARNPSKKQWVSYVKRNPDVRLKIGGRVYKARMSPIAMDDDEAVATVRRAYARKYNRPEKPPANAPPIQYYRVTSRP